MDQWRDHAVHCASEVGVKFRHNLVRDILVDICSKEGIMVRKEAPMGFLSEEGRVTSCRFVIIQLASRI
ncbi:exostosin-like protein [Artemisia annua]|uniref:Exostosin-like protein n=1 Tax=Artemisia annua TaxID=35608 RepID=A0A2U1Q5H7_ARTAN|nr:exostosin-like protein [Artemisia annua]